MSRGIYAGAWVAGVILAACIALKWWLLRYSMMDLGIIHQVFWNTAHGDLLWSSIQQTIYFGEHFKPVIFLLLPLYLLLGAHPLSLAYIQLAGLLSAVYPLALLARRRGLSPLRTGAIVLLLACNPILWNIALNEYHLAPLLLPGVLWIYYFYATESYRGYLLAALLTLLIREDTPLVVGMFGLLALIERRSARWVWPILLGSAAYFVGAMTIIGHLNPAGGYKYLAYFAPLGDTIPAIIRFSLAHPLQTAGLIFTSNYLLALLALVSCFLFLPLAAGPVLILAGLVLPITGIAIQATSVKGAFLLYSHYVSSLLAVGAIGCVEAHRRHPRLRRISDILFLLIVAASVVYLQLFFGPLPQAIRAVRAQEWRTARPLADALRSIPDTAAVISGLDTLAPLSSRSDLYNQLYIYTGKTQFLAAPYEPPENITHIVFFAADVLPYRSARGLGGDLAIEGPARMRAAVERYGLSPSWYSPTHIIFSKNGALPAPLAVLADDAFDTRSSTIGSPIDILGYRRDGDGIRLGMKKTAATRDGAALALRVGDDWLPVGWGLDAPELWAIGEVVGQYLPVREGTVTLAEVKAFQDLDGLVSARPAIEVLRVIETIEIPVP